MPQITGQPSVLYYADTIFDDLGMSDFSSGNTADLPALFLCPLFSDLYLHHPIPSRAGTVLIGLFKLLATLFAVFHVDHHGRKKLLYIGCTLMLLALLVLGTAFCFP